MKKSGQSTMEYIIIFSIVVGVIAIVAGVIKPKVEKSYNIMAKGISNKLQ
jgi:hypothetical protein